MDAMLTLQARGQKFNIPLLEFMADWFTMYKYSSMDEIEINTDTAWYRHPLPLLKQRFANDGPFVVCSVETLCNILCDDARIANWRLRFMQASTSVTK